ncbi:MAG: T9SS type A sorting domain-containing protein [Bacteroidota bacterium]
MKFSTPQLFLGVLCLVFQTHWLAAQGTDICAQLSMELSAEGIYCNSNKGAIAVKFSGGTSGEYVVSWDNHDNSIWGKTNTFFEFYHIQDLPAGDYTVKVMDFRTQCAVKKKISLKKGALPEGLVLTMGDVGCNGMGSLSAFIPYQQPPFHISLKGPKTANYVANNRNFRIHNLPAGDYEISFVENGCVATAKRTIGGGENLPKLSIEAVAGGCNVSTGAIVASASGGKPGYKLSWKGPTKGNVSLMETLQLNDFQTGTYNFTLEDANGCKSMATLDVDRGGLSIELGATQALCNQNGAIKVNIAGGKAPFTVNWRGGVTMVEGNSSVNGSTTLSLGQGTYLVEVKDSEGCSVFSSATIVEKPTDLYCSITPTATTCKESNGSIRVFISGGKRPYTLSYSGPVSGTQTVNGTTTFNNLPAGTYTTFLQDAEGCSVSESSEVTVGATENAIAAFDFAASGTALSFFNQSTAGTYEWTFGDGTTSSATSPNHTYAAGGSYEVCLTVTGKCNANTLCKEIVIVAFRNPANNGLQIEQSLELQQEESFLGNKIRTENFPNPFINETTIRFELPEAAFTTIQILNSNGKIVATHRGNYDKGQQLFTFNQNSLASGIYYYTITAGTYQVTNKMVVR